MTEQPPARRDLFRSLGRRMGLASTIELRQVEAGLREAEERSTSSLERQVSEMLDEVRVRWREEDELIRFLVRRARADIESEKIRRGQPTETRSRLAALRAEPDYALAWDEESPLVSVRIASYRDTTSLIERAIPSVLTQTYSNIELIIVNDGPNEQTREAVQALRDPRIRYEEFPARSHYPEDPHLRWMVAGSPGMNRGAELARGRWIAPLDDDDEFCPDHVENLLRLARSKRAEFAYGAIEQHRLADGDSVRIFSDPPVISQISMQAVIYHAGLRFIEYDTESWRVDEPGDWNLIRRMREAGVTMAATEDVVTTVYMVPFNAKTPKAPDATLK
ncbi:MAG: glycosyltransferase family 2 protein [Leucobacter sp.]